MGGGAAQEAPQGPDQAGAPPAGGAQSLATLLWLRTGWEPAGPGTPWAKAEVGQRHCHPSYRGYDDSQPESHAAEIQTLHRGLWNISGWSGHTLFDRICLFLYSGDLKRCQLRTNKPFSKKTAKAAMGLDFM